MSFQCPRCADFQSLEIETSLQLFKGRCDNEITLQIVECQRCQFSGAAVYEEGRRGAVDTRLEACWVLFGRSGSGSVKNPYPGLSGSTGPDMPLPCTPAIREL